MKAWHVVLGWALVNGVLVGLMEIFNEHPLFIAMYAIPVVTLVLAALLVRHLRRAPAGRERQRLAANSASALLAAIAVLLTFLGLVYGYWLIVLAAVALVAAFVRARREQLPAGIEPAPTRVPTLHTTLPGPSRRLDGVAKGARAATVMVLGAKAFSTIRRVWRGRKS